MISLRVETKRLLDWLESTAPRAIKYATSMALTWTSRDAAAAFNQELEAKLDNPTPFTKKGAIYRATNKDRLAFDVFVKDEASKGVPPSKYLRALAAGGYRKNKKTENMLRRVGILPPGWQIQPGQDAPLDKYGNLSGAKYVQILSALKAFQERGHLMNRTAQSQQRRAKSLRNYFVLYSMKTKTPVGVFTEKGKRDVKEILHFTPKRARYNKIFDFAETIAKVYHEKFEAYFREGLNRMLIKVGKW